MAAPERKLREREGVVGERRSEGAGGSIAGAGGLLWSRGETFARQHALLSGTPYEPEMHPYHLTRTTF